MDMLSEPLVDITQGSIVDGVDFGFQENPLGIVLSNACDFLNDKIGFVIIACLVPAKNVLLESKEFKNKIEGVDEDKRISNKKWGKLKPFFDDYILNKGVTRYFFINPDPVLDAPFLFATGEASEISELSSHITQLLYHLYDTPQCKMKYVYILTFL